MIKVEKEKESILNKILIVKGGFLNLERIVRISEQANFRANLNKINNFFNIKLSNQNEYTQFHLINFYNYN